MSFWKASFSISTLTSRVKPPLETSNPKSFDLRMDWRFLRPSMGIAWPLCFTCTRMRDSWVPMGSLLRMISIWTSDFSGGTIHVMWYPMASSRSATRLWNSVLCNFCRNVWICFQAFSCASSVVALYWEVFFLTSSRIFNASLKNSCILGYCLQACRPSSVRHQFPLLLFRSHPAFSSGKVASRIILS